MTASIYARRNRGVKCYVRQHRATYMWCLKFRYEKCQDSWFIHVSSFSVFYTEPWTGKRIVGERVGWSQHPWNMNISSSFSHHQQTHTHTHTHTRAGFPRGLRATVVLISRQVSEGLAGYSPGSSPRDMRCCMVIRQTLSLTERRRERGGSSRWMMKPRHYRKPPGPDKARENTSGRFIFSFLSNFWVFLRKMAPTQFVTTITASKELSFSFLVYSSPSFFFSRPQYFPWQAVHKPNQYVSYSFFWYMTSCLWVTGSLCFKTE